MAKCTVYLNSTASTSIEVEAENEDEAMELAYDKDMPNICAQCSGWGRSPGEPSLELSEVWEVSEVADSSGEIVWPGKG